MVLAITGLKRSGKNTVAEYICKYYNFVEYAFASPIKKASHVIFGWKPEDDDVLKEDIDPDWGISRRQFWQWFGTEAMQFYLPEAFPKFQDKIGRNIWVEAFNNLYKKDKHINYVITDFRFPHEKAYLDTIDAITLRVNNSRIKNKDSHESEKYVLKLRTDYELDNEGTIEDLHKEIRSLMEPILIRGAYRGREV